MVTYKEWYENTVVQYEIIRFTKNKECAMLTKEITQELWKSRRHMRIHNTQGLRYNIWKYATSRNLHHNLYTTVAVYKNGFPLTDHTNYYDVKREWKEIHEKEITSFPLFIDIDGNDTGASFGFVRLSMQKIHEYFNNNDVPHQIRYSGMGYHIIVPTDDLKKSFLTSDEDNIYKTHLKICTRLNEEISELIDLRIFDSKRLIKTPYSLAVYDEEMFVCLPLIENKEIYEMLPKDFRANNWIGFIKKRGTKLFNPNGSIKNIM